MRRVLLAILVTFSGVGTIVATGGPALAATDAPLVKCVDCETYTCHVVYGPAARNCWATPEGCISWEDCGL